MSLTIQATTTTNINKALLSELDKIADVFSDEAATGIFKGAGSKSDKHSIPSSLHQEHPVKC